MSSGFVSGGTIDQPNERDAEWLKAQAELEEVRRQKAEAGRQQDGKSLFEVLQQNKAAKQDAFEESIRLKNQFRALDDDEVDFLDAVLESTRAKEEAVKRDTQEQLDVFRRQQDEADRAARLESAPTVDSTTVTTLESPTGKEPSWAVPPRKRKRANEKQIIPGVKLRKSSVPSEASPTPRQDVPPKEPSMPLAGQSAATPTAGEGAKAIHESHETATASTRNTAGKNVAASPSTELSRSSPLGLVSYDSGEES